MEQMVTASREPVVIRVRLETDLDSYERIEPKFLDDFAEASGIPRDDIDVIEVQLGCVEVFLALQNIDEQQVKALIEQAKGDTPAPAIATLLSEYEISEIVLIKKFPPPFVSRFLTEWRLLEEDGETLTWLHLSDLHQKTGVGGAAQDRIATQLLEDLPGLLGEFGLEPDLLFFTGDLAHSGQTEEYTRVRSFLDDTVAALPTAPRVLMIPGNHDVSQGVLDVHVEDALHVELQDHAGVDTLFYDSDEQKLRRLNIRLRLSNFFDFLDDCEDLGQPAVPSSALHYTQMIEHGAYRIGVAGLNSAWRSWAGSDTGRLILGAPQLSTAGQGVKQADLRIALVHHPPRTDWYTVADRQAHRAKLGTFDVILRGHEHDPGALAVADLTSRTTTLDIPAGALYTTDKGYPNSCNLVRLNLSSGNGIVFFWRYYDDAMQWKEDISVTDRGRAPFKLATELVDRLGAAADRGRRSAVGD